MPLAEPGTGTVSSKLSTSCRVPKAQVTFSRRLVPLSIEDGGGMEVPGSDPFSVLTMVLVTNLVLYCVLNCLKQASTRLGGNIFLQKNIRGREVVRPWEGVQGDNS